MTHSDFTHLHIHTQYSLLDGACTLEKLIDKALQFKLPSLAITDHGNLFGAIKFYQLCVKKGIKPLIGCEAYVAPQSRFNKKEFRGSDENNFHIILLAKDESGYKNLVRLTSLGYLEGFYYKPRIDKDILAQYSQGLIGLSACLKGEIPSILMSADINAALKAADEYVHIFGKGNFYLEIMENGIAEQKKVNAGLIKISQVLEIPLVATNDVHYLEKEDAFAHEILLCIQTQNTITQVKRFKFQGDTFYLRSPAEMKTIFQDYPQALKNTMEITQKCNLTMDFSQVFLPQFSIPQGTTSEEYLRRLVEQNLPQRYSLITEQVKQRVDFELAVIKKTGFASYFLIVWDLIKYAKENHIPVGPGRGSAAGSIISYILGITDLDPLKYNLLFERFLNPARISMPDIDIDFCYEKRGEVIEYVAKKYGKDCVAQIVTFGTMLARAVVRDVGRAMGMSYGEVDKIAKMIPQIVGQQIELKDALTLNSDLKSLYTTDSATKKLIDVAMRLEGLSRHASTHAAGVVISDQPLINRIPLILGSNDEIVTGFDMESLEKTGMLKMDFLGLKTLTVIEGTVKIVKRTQGIELDMLNLPLDDANTFSLLTQSNTLGVFQLESRGMRDILRKLVPTKFEDIIAVLALYRPGPLGSGMVEDFIERKQGRKKVVYLNPKLEPILKETYGIILYQEQTMQIVSSLAGFSMAQADLLRKAIGKKIPEIMEEQRNLFAQGCSKNNIPQAVAEKIFELIDYFSGYGFNKSHSTAYALISYQTAYLKANYPVEFMAALLTSERNNTDKVVEYVNECGRMGIKVLPPDINTSFANFTVTADNNIRFGLMAIKNVGSTALSDIIEARKSKMFTDFFDFCERVDSRIVNKKVIESLIRCGAMDSFGLKRAQMAVSLDGLLAKSTKKIDAGQMLLFPPVKQVWTAANVQEWPIEQILSFEKDLLGFYITGHPINSYEKNLKFISRNKIISLYESEAQNEVTICVVLEKVKIITTKKNDRMAIVKVEDETAGLEVIVFPKLFAEVSAYLLDKTVAIIKGKLETKDKTPKILAEAIIPIERMMENVKKINIIIANNKLPIDQLKTIFANNRGATPVVFIFKDTKFNGVKIKTSEDFCLGLNEEVLAQITQLIGEENLFLTL